MSAGVPGSDLPVSIAVGVPAAVLALPVLAAALGLDPHRWLSGEAGAVELLTVAAAICGLAISLRVWRRRSALPGSALGAGALLFALGFLYIAGEETSWGQHWIGWATPEWYAGLNRQGETNLHNLGLAADRLPKALVGILVIAGGFWPLFGRTPPGGPYGPASWLMPTRALTPVAAAYLLVWIVDRLLTWSDLDEAAKAWFEGTELRELLLVCALALYVASIDRRLSARGEKERAARGGPSRKGRRQRSVG